MGYVRGMRDWLLIFCAGTLAGAINAVAGGGTLITFPTLIWLGRPPIVANATNALALWPGSLAGAFALRREAWSERRLLLLLAPVTVLGGVVGGYALLVTPARFFDFLVPGLVFVATCLLALRRRMAARVPLAAAGAAAERTRGACDPSSSEQSPNHGGCSSERWSLRRSVSLCLVQFLVSIYGGYFGAAMGILMLASLGLFGIADIHARNGVKNLLATLINGSAGLYFVASGAIAWVDAGVLAVASVIGGYAGARAARSLPAHAVERAVLAFGLIASLLLALRVVGRSH
jgi:uncharacterized membrane protein YfcA